MKKIFTLFAAALVVMSASAQDLSKLKNLSAENRKFEPIERPTTSPIRKATAAWENTSAPFATKYTVTGSALVESEWIAAQPWEMWAEDYDYEGDTWYGLVNIIPNEGLWVDDPTIDYFYNAETGQVVIPCTAMASYGSTLLIYIMDVTDFLNGGHGDIYFTLGQDGSFALDESAENHVIAWTVATYDEVTMDPVEYYGVFNAYKGMTYTSDAPSALENTAVGVKAQKVIENGQVVILRDGKKFNAVGAQL